MTEPSPEDLYTPEADAQLDDLAAARDEALYNTVLEAIEFVLDNTDRARSLSPALRDATGQQVLATPVMYEADPRWFVFWAARPAGPVILGVHHLPAF